jgi:hypothetical protein
MKKITFTILLICCIWSFDVQAISVEDAYAAIPHQRTIFDARASKLSTTQVSALQQVFHFADRGTVLRVEGLNAFRAGDNQSIKKVMADYRSLTASFTSLQVPIEIKPVQDLVLQAIEDHRRFFETKMRDKDALGKCNSAFTPDVFQASQKLHRAYSLLMQSFSNEPAVNKIAFFDYLCALDFL